MHLKSRMFVSVFAGIVALCASDAKAATGAQITFISNGSGIASGTLDGTAFSVSNFVSPIVSVTGVDMSAAKPAYDAAPLTDSEFILGYTVQEDISFVATAPIDDFALYAYFWKVGSYDFDQSFTILDGFDSATVQSGDVLVLTALESGILLFDAPVTTLNYDVTTAETGNIGTTFGVVPEPGSFALLCLGGLLLTARRRRESWKF